MLMRLTQSIVGVTNRSLQPPDRSGSRAAIAQARARTLRA
jgi:hypothetical protein